MAALNITHDLLHKQQHLDQQVGDNREQVRSLLNRVDSALQRNADEPSH
jgi:cell division protein ZapA